MTGETVCPLSCLSKVGAWVCGWGWDGMGWDDRMNIA